MLLVLRDKQRLPIRMNTQNDQQEMRLQHCKEHDVSACYMIENSARSLPEQDPKLEGLFEAAVQH